MLSNSQLKLLADILVALGQIFFASLVLPYFITGLGVLFLLSGILLTFGSWILCLIIIKNVTI